MFIYLGGWEASLINYNKGDMEIDIFPYKYKIIAIQEIRRSSKLISKDLNFYIKLNVKLKFQP